MKVVILAGGFGTRLSEDTILLPKPMIEIGGKPMLWHIMKIYAQQGFDEFVVALGYKGEIIKRYFFEYHTLRGNLTVDLGAGRIEALGSAPETWRIHLIETGIETMTGGRLLQLRHLLGDGTFMLTYGDGVANIDLRALVTYHRNHGRIATVTAVRPPSRFGGLDFNARGEIVEFIEKPQIGEGWINGGFMVLEPKVFEFITDDRTLLEGDVLSALAAQHQLMAYKHDSFWHCMDTLRDRRHLEQLWASGKAEWKIWN
jgi:glucose-1-phosphate cytidylyltransferase